MYTATLRCGMVLAYEAVSFVPARGDSVPCRRHGFCTVERHDRAETPRGHHQRFPRARARAQEELQEWLRGRIVTTISELRRHRFTLRMIAAAERDGLLTVDEETGTVAVR